MEGLFSQPSLPCSPRAAIAVRQALYIKYHVDIKGTGKSALKSIPLPTLLPAEGNIYSSAWDKLPY